MLKVLVSVSEKILVSDYQSSMLEQLLDSSPKAWLYFDVPL